MNHCKARVKNTNANDTKKNANMTICMNMSRTRRKNQQVSHRTDLVEKETVGPNDKSGSVVFTAPQTPNTGELLPRLGQM